MLSMLVTLVAAAAAAAPVPLDLEGEAIQGGLIIGRTAPGATVEFEGTSPRVSDEGVFLIAFGRDAEPEATVSVTLPDGSQVTRDLTVAQREYRVQRIDGLQQDKVTPPPDTMNRIREEYALSRKARRRNDDRQDFLAGFIWPLEGPITGVYGSQRILNGEPRRPHYGIDVAAPTGTPVVARADAVVTLVHPDMYFSGGTLIMDHGHGLSSTFIHLHKILVEEGQVVKQGEVVAEVGATGRVTGPHLDWRMNLFTVRIDPALLVPPMPALSE